jgi:hypothetical protein
MLDDDRPTVMRAMTLDHDDLAIVPMRAPAVVTVSATMTDFHHVRARDLHAGRRVGAANEGRGGKSQRRKRDKRKSQFPHFRLL